MFDKLDFILEKYEELAMKVSDPDVINDQPSWQKYIKEMGEMEPIVNKYKEYKKAKEGIADAREMLEAGDEELKELAKMELSELEDKLPQMEEELKILLLPKDPNDEKNVILEIRAGTGGEEAALFAQDLLRMYLRYAERRGWKTEIMDMNDTGIGGVKEAIVLIKGKGAKVSQHAVVSVNYTGWLLNGKVFDSSWTRGQSAEFSLDQVVKGWSQGLAGQTVGSQVLLVVPPSLGYGDQASGKIPANSTLVFVVDILSAN